MNSIASFSCVFYYAYQFYKVHALVCFYFFFSFWTGKLKWSIFSHLVFFWMLIQSKNLALKNLSWYTWYIDCLWRMLVLAKNKPNWLPPTLPIPFGSNLKVKSRLEHNCFKGKKNNTWCFNFCQMALVVELHTRTHPTHTQACTHTATCSWGK